MFMRGISSGLLVVCLIALLFKWYPHHETLVAVLAICSAIIGSGERIIEEIRQGEE